MASLFPPSSPLLPQFKTLLVEGNYHASAPVHLCVSYLAQSESKQVVLLHPSRTKLAAALKEFNDSWLTRNGGTGGISRYTRNVNILYPPTSTHLVFLLSMLHRAQDSDRSDFVRKTTFAWQSRCNGPGYPPICLSYHKLSPASPLSRLYREDMNFLTVHNGKHKLTTYSGFTVSLAVFDSGLTDLKLPILKPVVVEQLDRQAEQEREEGEAQQQEDTIPKTFSMAFLTYKFFEWIGTFEHVEDTSGSASIYRTFKLKRPDCNVGEESVWRWKESKDLCHRDFEGTTFLWV